MAIGFACGFASAFITKYTHHVRGKLSEIRNHFMTMIAVVEPVVLFGLAYLSYILAELFHFSGIIGYVCSFFLHKITIYSFAGLYAAV